MDLDFDLKDLFDDMADLEGINKKEDQSNISDPKDRRIHNQRKVINKLKSDQDDLKASLAFTDAESDLAHHEAVKLGDQLDRTATDLDKSEEARIKVENQLVENTNDIEKYRKRCEVLKKRNAEHLGKLVALQHILNRGASPVALR